MPQTSLQSLPIDICDRLLTFVPDYYSLQCAVLSSRCMYNAFASRRRSIMRAAGFNEVGSALPWAIALVRTRDTLGEDPLQVVLEGLNDPDPDSAYWKVDISPKESRALSAVSATSRRMESIFCVLYKDRTAPTSTLSEAESLRFHRALYRTWIIAVLLENDTFMSSVSDSPDVRFLTDLCEKEFVELHEVMLFLDAIYRTVMSGMSMFRGYSGTSRPLNIAPDVLLASMTSRFSIYSNTLAFSQPGFDLTNRLEHAISQRQIAKHFNEKYDKRAILSDSRIETISTCQKCGSQGATLFGENNWHLLHPTLGFDDLFECLPGHLPGNSCVASDTRSLIARQLSLTSIFSDMFDSQNDPESEWKKSDWLCISCIKEFWKERLFSWIVGQLVKDGHKFAENCWYGWNCRTQTHSLHHARRLNHLCEPTDRDDTGTTTAASTSMPVEPPEFAESDEDTESYEDTDMDE